MTITMIKNIGLKKKYLVAIIIGVCFLLSSIMGCGSSTDEVTGTVEQPEEETIKEENPIVEEDTPETEAVSNTNNNRVFVGDTFTAYYGGSPALEITVLDVGTSIDDITGTPTVYAELDIKNICDEQMAIIAALQGFYADDYLLDTNFADDDDISISTVAPGRKVKGKIGAYCPNYDQYSVIEMEFAERSVVIKDSSMANSDEMAVPENADTSELTYGTYVYHDTTLGNINTAEVGFASGEGANYIYIDSRGEGGHGVIEFVGYFQEANEDNSYTVIQSSEDYFEAEIRCTFVDGGLNIEVVSSEYDELYDAAGYYELESELNLDEVG